MNFRSFNRALGFPAFPMYGVLCLRLYLKDSFGNSPGPYPWAWRTKAVSCPFQITSFSIFYHFGRRNASAAGTQPRPRMRDGRQHSPLSLIPRRPYPSTSGPRIKNSSAWIDPVSPKAAIKMGGQLTSIASPATAIVMNSISRPQLPSTLQFLFEPNTTVPPLGPGNI